MDFNRIQDILPNILNNLTYKDLLNSQQINTLFYKEVKDIRKRKLLTRKNINLTKIYFLKWKDYNKYKFKNKKRVNSWAKRYRDPETPILLF